MSIAAHSSEYISVYCEKRPTAAQLDMIEKRLRKEDADVLLMSAYPALHGGYIDPHDFGCEYPQSDAFAVSHAAEKRFGSPDIALGTVAAYHYVNKVKSLGGRVAYAGDILIGSTHVPDITDTLLDCILLDAKQENRMRFYQSFSRVAGAFRHDPTLGNHSRKKLLCKLPFFLLKVLWYRTFGHTPDEQPASADFGAMLKRGTYIAAPVPKKLPLVSVVIRTHSRPDVLRETLKCLKYQIYKNIEYIIIEDGAPTAEMMIRDEFADLPIRYHATGENIGRSAAANLGFKMAKGRYINMLDDDDFLYPEHILTGVAEAEASGCGIIFLQSLALMVTHTDSPSYAYDVKQIEFMNFPRIDPFTMSLRCETPNNGVLFKKELFDRCGGILESLNAHEDWNLWLRYMANTSWRVVPYASCAFTNPFCSEERDRREEQYAAYDNMQFNDPGLKFNTTPEQLRGYYRGCIEDCHYMVERGCIDEYLRSEPDKKSLVLSQDALSFDPFAKAVSEASGAKLYSSNDFRALYAGFIKYLLSLEPQTAGDYIMQQYEQFV